MTDRTLMLGVVILTLMAAGTAWVGLAWANSRTGTTAADCCLDPTCPPGCSDVCPSDCTGPAGCNTKTSCCCDDPTCPPGCSPECPPDCLDLSAKAKSTQVMAKTNCPPCPFCP